MCMVVVIKVLRLLILVRVIGGWGWYKTDIYYPLCNFRFQDIIHLG
jgi:hypothetical protein